MLNNEYEFSIILFSSNNDLKKIIELMINQSLNFYHNLQLIICYDKDYADDINNYYKEYPNNIFEYKANDDLFNIIKGKYYSFIINDYQLTSESLENVKNLFEKNNEISNVIITGKETDYDEKVLDIKDSLFNTTHTIQLFQKNTTNDSDYYAVIKSKVDDSIVHNKINKIIKYKLSYYQKLNYLNLLYQSNLSSFIKYMLLNDIQEILTLSELNLFDDEEYYYQKINNLLRYIDEEDIFDNSNLKDKYKTYLLYLKNNKQQTILQKDDNVILEINNHIIDKFNIHKIWIDFVNVHDGFLRINGVLQSHFNNKKLNITVVDNDKNRYECRYIHYPQSERKDILLFGEYWIYRYNFEVKIPLNQQHNNQRYIFEVAYDKSIKYQPKIEFNQHALLSNMGMYFVKDNYIILRDSTSITITDYSYMKMIKSEIRDLRKILHSNKHMFMKFSIYRFIHLILYPFMLNRNIWFFNDRIDSADDNAKHLYRYALSQNDNIQKYFIIDKNAEDYTILKREFPNVINYGSYKHKFLYLFTDKIISSFLNESFYNPFYKENTDEYKYYKNMITAKEYFLQHGVISCDLTKHIKRFNHDLTLINTSAEGERNSFFELDYNYDQKVVQVLGLPRYDYLENVKKIKRQILFIPSWRSNLNDTNSLLNSDYYKSLIDFLNNEGLSELLSNTGYTLIFKPHPEMEKHITNFVSDNVIFSNESFQDLFNNSALLISDFSSVIFDFAYLKKPVIYYQPNDDYHYEKGYFDYDTMGFGNVVYNMDELLLKIREYLENGCLMEEKYQKRVDNFFKYHDKENSKRVYEWILDN